MEAILTLILKEMPRNRLKRVRRELMKQNVELNARRGVIVGTINRISKLLDEDAESKKPVDDDNAETPVPSEDAEVIRPES